MFVRTHTLCTAMLADMHKSIDTSYGFLGKSALGKLQEQMGALTNICSVMSGAKALREAIRAPNSADNLVTSTCRK